MIRKVIIIGALVSGLQACGSIGYEDCTLSEEDFTAAREMGKGGAEWLQVKSDTCRARNGDKHAQLALARRLEFGTDHVAMDEKAALKMYELAGTSDPTSTTIYVPGIKGQPGHVQIIPNNSARPGLPQAMYRAGLMYAEGRGTRKDMRKARRWMKRAAKTGYPPASLWLEANPER